MVLVSNSLQSSLTSLFLLIVPNEFNKRLNMFNLLNNVCITSLVESEHKIHGTIFE